jgi:hypothetical protein
MSEGGHGGTGKGVALTMAALGALLAVCAALVGAQRTELIAAKVAQSTHLAAYRAESTKFRAMDGSGELLHALTPSQAETAKFERALRSVRSHTGKADDEDSAELKDMIDVSTRSVADVLTPDPEDEARLASIRARYRQDAAEAKEDADAFDAVIEAHERAAEGYERAQVAMEVGIVVAAIAMLAASRAAWFAALAIGIFGAGTLGVTYTRAESALKAAEAGIVAAKTNAAKMNEE